MGFSVEAHYSRPEVAREVAEFAVGRWVALEGSFEGRRVFIRYFRGVPLTVRSPGDVLSLISRYRRLGARTFYATVHVYRDISSRGSVEDLGNVAYTTPFLDVDGSLERYSAVLEVVRVIVEFLERYGISRSVYVLWSGEGAHVRVNERAFSGELLSRYHPLAVSYAVAEYVLRSLREKLDAVARSAELRVENLVDAKRVFTAPLSLHRQRDVVAVCFKPDAVTSFDPSWVDPRSYRHDPSAWRSYEPGEADTLALEALRSVDPLRVLHSRLGTERRPTRPRVATGTPPSGIGRFQVMAVLQAARYYLLYGDIERAKSFGLNRAIFYAWAKHYGRGYVPKRYRRATTALGIKEPTEGQVPEELKEGRKLVKAAGEEVYVSPRGYFVMGDREQLPEDYDRSVAEKVEEYLPYDLVWEAALKYVSRFPKHVLEDPAEFYERVYEPVRDRFVEVAVGELQDGEDSREVREAPRQVRPSPSGSYGLLKWSRRDLGGRGAGGQQGRQ